MRFIRYILMVSILIIIQQLSSLSSAASTPSASSSPIFTDSGQSLGSLFSSSVALGDLDGDNDLDAFVANYISQANKVWLNDGTGNFSDSGLSLGNGESYDVALGDVDGDGDLDALVANYNSQANKLWLNDGAGNFSDSGQSLGSSSSLAVELADLNADGYLDAFIGNLGANKVWLNDGTGLFTDSGQSLGTAFSWAVALSDVDSDGDLDAFVGNSANQANTVWLNDGSGNFIGGQSLGSATTLAVALSDVNSDGYVDAFVGNSLSPNKLWLNDETGLFTDSGQSLGSLGGQGVVLEDIDGDGDFDAFVGNALQNEVWQNDGAGIFTDSGLALGSSNSMGVALGDLDGDNDLDAFVANTLIQANKVWLNETPVSAEAQLYINPAESSVNQGYTTTVDIAITNVSDLFALDLELSFDPALVEGVTITPGSCPVVDYTVVSDIDNALGTIDYAVTSLIPTPACNGDGVVATLTFEGVEAGITPIEFVSVELSDSATQPISVTTQDGLIDVLPTETVKGCVVFYGRPSQSLNSPLPSASLPQHEGAVVTAWVGNSEAITTTTDTEGCYQFKLPAGTYKITVEADLYLDGEKIVDIPSGTVTTLPTVTLLGGDIFDYSSDTPGEDDKVVVNEVEHLHFIVVSNNPDLTCQDDDYDSRADINADCVIDSFDVQIIAHTFTVYSTLPNPTLPASPVPWP